MVLLSRCLRYLYCVFQLHENYREKPCPASQSCSSEHPLGDILAALLYRSHLHSIKFTRENGLKVKCPSWSIYPPNIVEFFTVRSPFVNLLSYAHFPTSLVPRYTFGQIPETAGENEEAERVELLLII